jgi:hypothetical protein
MKKHALLIAALALIAVVACTVPTAFADSSSVTITPANGNDVVLPDGTVYQQNDDGSWSWIPNIATANAMGIDWSSLQPVTVVPGPIEAPFPAVVTLTNASPNRAGSTGATTTGSSQVPVTPANGNDYVVPDGQVYQENADGSFSWIPDVATGNAMGLDWNALTPVDTLPGPVGTPFPIVDGA